MIKAIFFDAGGTLIHPHPSVGAVYAAVAERHGVSMSPLDLNVRFKEAWKKEKSRQALVDKSWWNQVVKHVFKGQAFRDWDVFFEDLYNEFEKKQVWEIFPDAIETLTELRRRGLRLAIASNWDARLPALLKSLELAPFFDRAYISFELGVVKPDPLFFRKALGDMKLTPMEAVHVGDDPDVDARAAENVGMRAYIIDRTSKPKNSRSLSSLGEILLRI